MLKIRHCCAAALLAATLTTPASALVTYHYSGHNGPNSEGTSAYPYVPLLASMSFDFTIATALAPNLAAADITASVISWIASAGTARSTITSQDPNPYASQIGFRDLVRVSTDLNGNITTFRILVAAVVSVEPDTEAEYLFERAASSPTVVSDSFAGYSLSRGGSPFVSAVCNGTGACGGSTTFAIAAVPEPAAWALWPAGLLAGLAMLRRQRQR